MAFVGAYGVELAVGLGTSLAAFGATAWVLVRMPEDYLERPEGAPFWPERPRWMQIAGKRPPLRMRPEHDGAALAAR